MCKNRIDPDRPQMVVRYGAENMLFACGISNARAETHINTVFNIYFLLTAVRNMLWLYSSE